MKDESEDIIPIPKRLEEEIFIKEHVNFYPLAGASIAENYHSPDAYVFIFFEIAEGTHTIDFVEYEEKAFQIHLSFPGQIHSWNTKKNTKGYKIIVSRFFIERYMYEATYLNSKINLYPVLNVDKQLFHQLISDLTLVASDLIQNEVEWKIVILRTRLILTKINLLLEKNIATKRSVQKNNLLVHNFDLLLEQYFMQEKAVAFYSERLFITPNYLNIICRRYKGLNAKNVINNRIILEAKRLLLGTDLSIKEIAYKLGFIEVAHFSAFVKTKTDFSPRQLREFSYKSKK
ncbi:AraC family transcriptional regulator [Elizabethkingia anophelis]|nr:AraC family transcriptional regulator [Elizabethkingia anophelis]